MSANDVGQSVGQLRKTLDQPRNSGKVLLSIAGSPRVFHVLPYFARKRSAIAATRTERLITWYSAACYRLGLATNISVDLRRQVGSLGNYVQTMLEWLDVKRGRGSDLEVRKTVGRNDHFPIAADNRLEIRVDCPTADNAISNIRIAVLGKNPIEKPANVADQPAGLSRTGSDGVGIFNHWISPIDSRSR